MNNATQSRLDAWRWLASAEGEALREKVKDWTSPLPAQVTALRKHFSQEVVHAALQWAAGRAKAKAKFGTPSSDSTSLWCDPEGVEMASGPLPAAWKAQRFASLLPKSKILDICCGIGADAIALRDAGLDVTCVDLDPLRSWMAEQNTHRPALTRDARELAADETFWREGPGKEIAALHIDPARRESGGAGGGGGRSRIWKFADIEPGPEVLRAVLARCPHACIKLSPGLNFSEVHQHLIEPAGLERRSQIEIISQRGKLVQGLVWTGSLASTASELHVSPPSSRRATLLTNSANWSLAGEPDRSEDLETMPLSRYFFEVDDAIERAELLATLIRASSVPLAMAHPKLGLFVTKADFSSPPKLDPHITTWLTPFELVAEMPWNERKVEERLRQLDAGIVEVKTRDGAVNPDELQTRFSHNKRDGKLSEKMHSRVSDSLTFFHDGKTPRVAKVPKITADVSEVPQFQKSTFVLFVLRFGQSFRAIIARRVVADV